MRTQGAVTAVVLAGALGVLGGGCKTVVKTDPEAVRQHGFCRERLEARDLEAADGYCDRALTLSPQYADAWTTKGLVMYRRGQKDEARTCFERAVRHDGKQAQAHDGLGALAFADARFSDAEDRFQKAVSLAPDNANHRYHLALTRYFLKKDSSGVRKDIAELTQKFPKSADLEHLLAVIRLADGAVRDGFKLTRRALEQDPTVGAYWLTLGVAYARLNRREDAEYAFRSCLFVRPEEEDCAVALQSMDDLQPLPAPKLPVPEP